MRSGRKILLFCAATIGLSLYFFGWALSSPVGSSADETRHLTSILCGDTGGTELCVQTGGQTFNVRIPRLVSEGLQCMDGRLDDAANCQVAVDVNETTEVRYPGYDNYPGFFYEGLQLLMGENLTRSVVLMRMANGLLASVIFASLFSTAKNTRPFVGISIIAVLWSPVSFLIPSVNPSSWSILGAIALPISVVLLRDAKAAMSIAGLIFHAVTAACSIGLMAASRFDSLLAIPVILLTTTLCWRYEQKTISNKSRCFNFFISGGLVVGFVALTAFFRVLSIFDDPFEGPPRHHQTVLAHNVAELPNYLLGFVGADPWNVSAQQGMRVPELTIMSSVSVLILVMATAWRKHSVVSRRVLGMALLTIVVSILALHQSAMFYIPKLIQPRYFAPLLIGCLVAFIVTTPSQLSKIVLRWSIALTFVGQSLVLYQNFRRYVIGLREVGNDDLGCLACSMEDIGWWWQNFSLSPVVTWAVSVSGLCLALVAVYLQHNPEWKQES